MHASFFSRRHWLASAGLVAGIGTSLLAAEEPTAEPPPADGAEALARLKEGNLRFADGKTRHAHESANWRKHLLATQKPFATVLGCADSRVPPELVFDQGFGDIFVVRVAGNVIADDVVGSIAYAALHLATPLFVVMGHSGCGAVTAALDARLKQAKEPEKIAALLKLIDPSLNKLDWQMASPRLLDAAVEANVRWSVQQLAALPQARQLLSTGKVKLVGAVYELDSGKVRFL